MQEMCDVEFREKNPQFHKSFISNCQKNICYGKKEVDMREDDMLTIQL